ncbi:UDP-N-acetyl-D-mannosamine dehydrogenase [Actinoplanes sp. SE50]|uniref:UDP-N-acetyl-D-mannosamine dehydrogenase n=1 Tax=unclassified Actinoplanes TaxID=2626549 RepID=UPI00023ECF1D|nr:MULTISPECIES: UDP-N-acetyl-D-mannosamine dehydrogenase [unclassified Actinoplanes]AEV86615.1 UDP-N-acetyl-D-mannosamine dehydrogenase [Actinoplanes sp. SE50/110]ATO85013.1 UDP-N-acetyl-D-mannosamine dehydrogenase [Actinoplanes sp. SE50]SLM02422.1 UDP-N-acetyl-D-mannosamine dehydrogenase [Actinoplanes sp. SE50/110]
MRKAPIGGPPPSDYRQSRSDLSSFSTVSARRQGATAIATSAEFAATRHRVAVVGQDRAGLALARAAVTAGHTVVGFDHDAGLVAELRAGRSPLGDDLVRMHETGRYHVTDDPAWLSGCTVHLIAVPAPPHRGRPDLSLVLAAADTVAGHLRDQDLVVLESRVAPGTTRGVFQDALAARSSARYLLAFAPDRNGHAKLAGGVDRRSTLAAAAFYRTMYDVVVACATAEEAEAANLTDSAGRRSA